MKFFSLHARILALAAAIATPIHGQTTADTTLKTYILGAVSDGKETVEPVSKPVKSRTVDSPILGTMSKLQNGRMVTIHQVEPLEPLFMPRRKAPVPAVAPEDNPVLRNTPAARPMRTIGVSSTVYGTGQEKRTRLTLHYENKNYHAWSNIDFRHLHGFAAYKANGRDYFFLLGAELERDTRGNIMGIKNAYRAGCPRSFAPANSRADFTFIGSKEKVTQEALSTAREILEDIHELYRKEKPRLTAAHKTRLAMAPINAKRARERREAPPKDITIRFWKRDVEQEQLEALKHHAAQKGESK